MNLMQLKYIVETASTGSIKQASEVLCVSQPALSRSIRITENEYGIVIFDRNSKGMAPTPDGAEFIAYAEKILSEVSTLETRYKHGMEHINRFSVCVPRSKYISEAFSLFTRSFNSENSEMKYKETNTVSAVDNVASSKYDLAIIRYAASYDDHYNTIFADKELNYEYLNEFRYSIAVSKTSPLAAKESVELEDLTHFIEIVYVDPSVRDTSPAEERAVILPEASKSRIYVYERTSMFDILAENNMTFMWVAPVSENILERYGAVIIKCTDNDRSFRDVLIYRSDYCLGVYDKMFIDTVKSVLRSCPA